MTVKIISVYNLDKMATPEYPEWTPSEVVQNLQTLGLGKYGTAFLDNDVNGEALIYLKDSHLKELGVKLIGHRLTLINFINNLKSNKSIQPNRPSLRSTPSSSSHNEDIAPKSTKSQYQDDDNSAWMQRRSQQKQTQFRQQQQFQQQQQQQQMQQDEEDNYSHRSTTRKSQVDDHSSYRVAKKVSNDDENNNNYFQSRNQRRNYQDNSDSDTNMPKQQNDWEQKRKQMQMRQQYQQQEPQQPTRTLSNERFQNRQNNFNDTSLRKTPDQYGRRNQNNNYNNNHYDDNDNFDEEENPFVSRPKIRDNPMSSPAVKTSAYSNNYHNNVGNDDDYDDKGDEDEGPYQRTTQRNQQRDDYYSRHAAPQQRKTPNRQGSGSNSSSNNRYSAPQQDYQDDHIQSNRRQPYRSQVQQQYDNDDDDQGGDDDDDDQGYQDDYQKYPPQRQPQNTMRQQQQQPPPQISNQPQERVECKYCGRKFAIDRIDKHEAICLKTSQKKKKPFDARKMRIKGSEAEQFIHKMDDDNTPPNKSKNGVPKYKLEHEKLISNLRAARQFTEYENNKASGKPVGPPPALPSYPEEDDDREQCPYCGRKFAPEAAKRHIPVCERMNGNKSKMQAGTRRAGKR